MPCVTRRDAMRIGLLALSGPLLACTDASTVAGVPLTTSPDDAVRRIGDVVEIDTTRVPAWTAAASLPVAVVFLPARLIVVRRDRDQFSALSAECPHAGCGVSIVERTRLLCPCHGSAFDFAGTRLEGPAPSGLQPLAATFSRATGRLLVQLV